jgi:DNA-binding NarL/FixJ family response regulator
VKRVLVVIKKVLLRVGLESLLSQHQDLHIKTIVYQNEKALVAEIRDFQPVVILMDEAIQLDHHPNVLGMLLDFPNIKLLVVNSKENRLHVFEKKEIRISQSADFINAIRD